MNNDELRKSVEEKTQDKKGDVRIPGRPPSVKEIIEEEAKKPEKKVSRYTNTLIRDEENNYRRAKLGTIASILLFFLMIVLGYFLNPIFCVFAILIFLLLLISISIVINRKYFKKYLIDSFYLSEHYKFYLKKLIQLLKDYNKIPEQDKDYRKPDAKKIRYCIMDLYSLTTSWDNPPEGKTSDIYIDLFTKNLYEFNFKLKILLLRLNGLIDKLEEVPLNVVIDLEWLLKYLDENSLELTQGHLNCLNSSIKNLEEKHPEIWEKVIREPIISNAVKKFLGKYWKLFLGVYIWFFVLCIYGIFVTNVDLGISNDAKFYGGVIIGTAVPPLLYKLFKGR